MLTDKIPSRDKAKNFCLRTVLHALWIRKRKDSGSVCENNFENVTVGTASGEEPLSASTLPRFVQSTELNIRNKEKNFRKYQGSKNPRPIYAKNPSINDQIF